MSRARARLTHTHRTRVRNNTHNSTVRLSSKMLLVLLTAGINLSEWVCEWWGMYGRSKSRQKFNQTFIRPPSKWMLFPKSNYWRRTHQKIKVKQWAPAFGSEGRGGVCVCLLPSSSLLCARWGLWLILSAGPGSAASHVDSLISSSLLSKLSSWRTETETERERERERDLNCSRKSETP